MVQGTLMYERSLCRVGDLHVLARADYKSVAAKQVAILSGGGSGHEPAHAGELFCTFLNIHVDFKHSSGCAAHDIPHGLIEYHGMKGCFSSTHKPSKRHANRWRTRGENAAVTEIEAWQQHNLFRLTLTRLHEA
jgi:hypothetical protein